MDQIGCVKLDCSRPGIGVRLQLAGCRLSDVFCQCRVTLRCGSTNCSMPDAGLWDTNTDPNAIPHGKQTFQNTRRTRRRDLANGRNEKAQRSLDSPETQKPHENRRACTIATLL